MDLTTLDQYIVLETPGVAPVLMAQTILEVLKDFCTRTHAWRYILDRFNTVEDQENYTIDEWPDEAKLLMVERITTYNMESDETDYIGTKHNLDAVKLDVDRKIITFLQTPQEDAANDMEIEVSLVPGRSMTEIPTIFFDEYYLTLAKGVKSNLMRMIGKAWSNPNRGVQLEVEYRNERGNAAENTKSDRYDNVNRKNKGVL